MKVLPFVFRIMLGGIFILSGILKLYPIEPFEYNLAYLPGITLKSSVYLARIIISVELLLGVLLIVGISIRKFTLPLATFIILAFTIYLGYGMIMFGNQQNCGCFGTFLEMSSVESIIKNILMLGILLFLFNKPGAPLFRFRYTFVVAALVAFAIPVILNPPWYYESQIVEYDGDDESLDLGKLPALIKENGDTLNLREPTNQLIAFMSVDCDHCKNAALRLGAAKEKGYINELYIYFFGDKKQVLNFFESTEVKVPIYNVQQQCFFCLLG